MLVVFEEGSDSECVGEGVCSEVYEGEEERGRGGCWGLLRHFGGVLCDI